jgi:hypothetical protein
MEPEVLLQVLSRKDTRGFTQCTFVIGLDIVISVQTKLSIHLNQGTVLVLFSFIKTRKDVKHPFITINESTVILKIRGSKPR